MCKYTYNVVNAVAVESKTGVDDFQILGVSLLDYTLLKTSGYLYVTQNAISFSITSFLFLISYLPKRSVLLLSVE